MPCGNHPTNNKTVNAECILYLLYALLIFASKFFHGYRIQVNNSHGYCYVKMFCVPAQMRREIPTFSPSAGSLNVLLFCQKVTDFLTIYFVCFYRLPRRYKSHGKWKQQLINPTFICKIRNCIFQIDILQPGQEQD